MKRTIPIPIPIPITITSSALLLPEIVFLEGCLDNIKSTQENEINIKLLVFKSGGILIFLLAEQLYKHRHVCVCLLLPSSAKPQLNSNPSLRLTRQPTHPDKSVLIRVAWECRYKPECLKDKATTSNDFVTRSFKEGLLKS